MHINTHGAASPVDASWLQYDVRNVSQRRSHLYQYLQSAEVQELKADIFG